MRPAGTVVRSPPQRCPTLNSRTADMSVQTKSSVHVRLRRHRLTIFFPTSNRKSNLLQFDLGSRSLYGGFLFRIHHTPVHTGKTEKCICSHRVKSGMKTPYGGFIQALFNITAQPDKTESKSLPTYCTCCVARCVPYVSRQCDKTRLIFLLDVMIGIAYQPDVHCLHYFLSCCVYSG